MQWSWHRDRWTSAAAAVDNSRYVEGLENLHRNQTVAAALAHIEMAERAIASIANEALVKYYDEPEEV